MQVTVTLTFGSEAEAAAFLAGKTPEKEATKTTGKPVKGETPAATQPTAAPTPAPTAAPAAAPTPAADTGGDYMKSGLPELIQSLVAKDRPAAIALLAKHGVKKGGELKPDQFAAVKADLEKALAPAEDLT